MYTSVRSRSSSGPRSAASARRNATSAPSMTSTSPGGASSKCRRSRVTLPHPPTTATVGGGGAGGLFIPLVVAGALTGRALGGIAHALDTNLFVVVGVAAFLGAGYRVPLAGVMFVAETTGRPGFVVPGLLAAVAAELVMGRSAVTTYQQTDDS